MEYGAIFAAYNSTVIARFRYLSGLFRITSWSLWINWLQVLGTTETSHIDQGVRQQFHPIVALLDVLETEQQPLAFVLPGKRPFDSVP